MTTPANELRQAADKLRRICTAAAPGPWTIAEVPPYTDPLLMSRYEETPDDEDVLIVGTVDLTPEDRAAVQLLHPGVGAALADWLEETAKHYDAAVTTARHIWGDEGEEKARAWLTTGHGRVGKEALAVARQINGAAP